MIKFKHILGLIVATSVVYITSSNAEEQSVKIVRTTSNKINLSERVFSVKLNASRVVYSLDSVGASLSIVNQQDYPMLVQSSVFAENKKDAASFIITPPLFRLDGKQQSRIRIVRIGGDFPTDRESLNWLCVTGIPPKNGDIWGGGGKIATNEATLDVTYRVSNCIKLLIRPSSLKNSNSELEGGKLVWTREGDKIKVSNPSPYYITVKDVKVGASTIQLPSYIPPQGEVSVKLPVGASSKLTWKVITDYGGDSLPFTGLLN